MCPPALPSPIGQGSLVQRELSPGGRLRDCPRLLDTSGMLSAACPTHPLRPLAQMLRPAPLARAVDGASLSSRRGRCPHRPVAWHPGRTVGAGLRPRPLLPGLREVSIESVGADPCVGPDTFLPGTRPRPGHIGPPLHNREGFRNQRKLAWKRTLPGGAGQKPAPCAKNGK